MNSRARVARDDQIVIMKTRGLTYNQIAEALGIDRGTALRAMQEWRDSNPKLRTKDPLDIIDEALEGYQSDLNELAMVSSTTKQEAVRVGAINSRMQARDRIITLLQTTGILPHDLGKLRVEIDIRYIAVRLVQTLNKWGIDEEVQQDLLAVLRGEDEQLPVASQN